MIRVTALSYLNTVPFVYGLKQGAVAPQITLSLTSPAVAAHQLQHNLCDLAIVPVAIVPSLPYYKIIGNYCIGATSEVASVLVCSYVPIEQIREVALDSESRTSVLLAKLLFRDYWHISPRYVPLSSDFPTHLPKSVVLIGDKALRYRDKFPFVYDLATHWIRWTGQPFVFAAWVANKTLPDGFAALFDEALAYGVAHIDEAITTEVSHHFPAEMAQRYLTQNLSFTLDKEKREGLQLFWELIKD